MKPILVKSMIGLLVVLGAAACMGANTENAATINQTEDYGVFLSLKGREAVEASEGYDIAVIDAQNLSADEIAQMQARGQTVYSYLNVGSLETFRPYYEEYESLTLKPYENWENEFWVDNVDVYGQFPTEETCAGVEYVLKSLISHGRPVVINGGDQFVKAYLQQNQQVDDILTGVNQETVFSSINFSDRSLGTQKETTHNYYVDYLNDMDAAGVDVFLLEYTTNSELAAEINEFTAQKGWRYFISDSIELDG
ncbi:endo alpha-1,4 polygalactosaminidase [Atopococcus tabaci]|uniref:endo alpha-1,4 polygalactosaminidase n=1 Tax=Atopococcus tabaci TaxID=269774 RepID=UPI0024095186|nr:endo alpha-1,4 polygalactosaminidase [Atopococcus tabaci]